MKMGTPELYISAQCIKITSCTNKEAKELIEKGEEYQKRLKR